MSQSESSSTDAGGDNACAHARTHTRAAAVSDLPGLQMKALRLVFVTECIKLALPNLLASKWDFN